MTQSASGPKMERYAKKPLPNYETVPLRSEEITVAAAQMTTKTVDAKNPGPVVKENLQHMLWLTDVAQRHGHIDLIVFPEFTLQGSESAVWTREDMLRLAIEMPGEESELIGKKARQHNCYIVVSSYTKQSAEWPNHFFNASFIVAPTGKVISHHWKATQDPGRNEMATTVHDVLDQFTERYGWDAVWPVARTDIGNIGHYTCSEGFIPETARAFAFKGAEILAWSLTGGAGRRWAKSLAEAYCGRNDVFGVVANAALRPPGDYALETGGCGNSYIVSNTVDLILAESFSLHETVVTANLPISTYRKKHSIPLLRKELYLPVYEKYEGKYPPNLYAKYLPGDPADGVNHARKNARW